MDFEMPQRPEFFNGGAAFSVRRATRACTHKDADVGFERLSGNRMLDQSITGFDPKRTCVDLDQHERRETSFSCVLVAAALSRSR
jgi:hypothetical protein